MKLSVDVRNDVYNLFQVLLVLDSLYSFDNLNEQKGGPLPKKKSENVSHPDVTIHTPIESPSRVG